MNRTTILLLLFVLLGGASYWMLSNKKEAPESVLGWDRQFKVENIEDIHKIFIAKRTGENTTLERKGENWIYNGKYKVRSTAINTLLKTIQEIRIKYVPPQNSMTNMVANLATEGIKVEIYDRGGDLMKAYYVGGSTPDERGTYMIQENADQPYVVELPMLEGALRVRYDMEGDDWRDKTVFGYQVEDIAELSIEYPKQKNKSFKLKKDGGDYSVEPFYDITVPKSGTPSNALAENFLTGFERQIAESYINDSERKAAVLQQIPFANFTLKTTEGKEKLVSLYPLANEDAYGAVKSESIDRYYAKVYDGELEDFMLVQHRNFGKVLWAYESFFQ